MACEALISDWNGTLIQYRTEMPALERVGVDAFRASIPFHPLRALRILKARGQLRAIRRQGRPETDFDFIKDMFRVFNRMVVSGLPTSVVEASFDRYAKNAETQSRLDLRLLRLIRESHEEGRTTGILSAGYRYGIERVLTVAGYRHYFDFCEADEFRSEDGRVIEFGLNIYRNKPKLLLRLLTERHLEAAGRHTLATAKTTKVASRSSGIPSSPSCAPRLQGQVRPGVRGIRAGQRSLSERAPAAHLTRLACWH